MFQILAIKLSHVSGDLAQDHHLRECKLVSSFFLWTLPALSIPPHSMHPSHLTHNALRVFQRVFLPVYAPGISGWELWGFPAKCIQNFIIPNVGEHGSRSQRLAEHDPELN